MDQAWYSLALRRLPVVGREGREEHHEVGGGAQTHPGACDMRLNLPHACQNWSVVCFSAASCGLLVILRPLGSRLEAVVSLIKFNLFISWKLYNSTNCSSLGKGVDFELCLSNWTCERCFCSTCKGAARLLEGCQFVQPRLTPIDLTGRSALLRPHGCRGEKAGLCRASQRHHPFELSSEPLSLSFLFFGCLLGTLLDQVLVLQVWPEKQ